MAAAREPRRSEPTHFRPHLPVPAGRASHAAKPRVDEGWRSGRSDTLSSRPPHSPHPQPHSPPLAPCFPRMRLCHAAPTREALRPHLTSCHVGNTLLPCKARLSCHLVNKASLLPPRDLASVSPPHTAGPEQEQRYGSFVSLSLSLAWCSECLLCLDG